MGFSLCIIACPFPPENERFRMKIVLTESAEKWAALIEKRSDSERFPLKSVSAFCAGNFRARKKERSPAPFSFFIYQKALFSPILTWYVSSLSFPKECSTSRNI